MLTPVAFARAVIKEAAVRNSVAVSQVMHECRQPRVVKARIEAATVLQLNGWSQGRIGRFLKKDCSTISCYLGKGKKKPIKPGPPVWHKPHIGLLYLCPKDPPDELPIHSPVRAAMPPKPKKKKQYLIPYAGFGSDYIWKERPRRERNRTQPIGEANHSRARGSAQAELC